MPRPLKPEHEKAAHVGIVILSGVVLLICTYTKVWFFVGWAVVAGACSTHRLLDKR